MNLISTLEMNLISTLETNLISTLDLISLIITAIIFLFIYKQKYLFSCNCRLIFIFLLCLRIFFNLSNFLQWTDITDALDKIEDYILIIEVIFWFLFFYSFIEEFSKTQIKKSENKYKQAFNQVEFYKDLFTHDMNNIFQSLLSSNQLCSDYLHNSDKLDLYKEILSISKNQIERGTNLISNIQKLSELGKYQMELERIDIIETIMKVKDTLLEKRKNIDIKSEFPDDKLYIQADILLVDIFKNLILNSIQHNKNPIAEIFIRIYKIKKENIDCVKIEIFDNGVGITKFQKDTIFKRNLKDIKNHRGSGLGLTLVKEIIKMYNGEIWVGDKIKGDPSKGSIFHIILPELI